MVLISGVSLLIIAPLIYISIAENSSCEMLCCPDWEYPLHMIHRQILVRCLDIPYTDPQELLTKIQDSSHSQCIQMTQYNSKCLTNQVSDMLSILPELNDY